jgi:hypothetical protein
MPSNDYVNTARNNTGERLFSVRSATSLYQGQFFNEKSSRSVLRVLLAEKSASEDSMCNSAVKIRVVHVNSVNV